MICPLCANQEQTEFDRDKTRSYHLCSHCTLVYVPREQIVSPEEEKERYDSHENSSDDSGYVSYLRTISDAMTPHLKRGSQGLDFGCGRTTVLSELLEKNDFKVDTYDLYFFPREEVWGKKYDFIVLSEVIEHLATPYETMKRLSSLLSSSGMIFVKTKMYPKNPSDFKRWFYKRDKTHVQFFSDESFSFLAKELSLNAFEKIGEDLYLFKK